MIDVVTVDATPTAHGEHLGRLADASAGSMVHVADN
jgi:hypothetical protein